jgi:hypothetical protein
VIGIPAQGDEAVFQEAFEALSPEEQKVVLEAMQSLQHLQEVEEGDDEDKDLARWEPRSFAALRMTSWGYSG